MREIRLIPSMPPLSQFLSRSVERSVISHFGNSIMDTITGAAAPAQPDETDSLTREEPMPREARFWFSTVRSRHMAHYSASPEYRLWGSKLWLIQTQKQKHFAEI